MFDLNGTANSNVFSSFYGGNSVNNAIQQPRPQNPLDFVGNLGGYNGSGQVSPSAASTYKAPAPSGGSAGGAPVQQQQQQQAPQQPSWEDQQRGIIQDKWNSYFGELDNMFNGLNDQANNQNQIVNNTYGQGVSDLNSAQDQNNLIMNNQRASTETNRTRNLADIADNITNLMNAGNVFLGSRGAGDSSASNQYAYALTKLGSKERGNVNMNTDNILNDINTRESNLRTTYTQAIKQLDTDKQNKMLSVASWLADAQNQIKQAKANGQLGRGQDLQQLSTNVLNYAMQQIQQVNAQNMAQRSALEQWALNTSTSVGQVKDKMSQLGGVNYSMPQAQGLNGTPSFGSVSNSFSGVPGVGFGSGNTDQKDNNIFAGF